MRIALVSPYSWTYPGGVTRHIEALGGELERLGHEVSILTPSDPHGRLSARCHRGVWPQRRVLAANVTVLGRTVGLPANGAVSNVSLSPLAVVRLWRELRRGGYDVVHVHDPIVPLISWLALSATGRPLVGTFHTYSTNRLTNNIGNLFGAARRFHRLRARIAVSAAAAWTGERFFGGRYRVIPNGVALPERLDREPATMPSAQRPLRIAFVGQAVERKGLPVALRAFEALREQVPARLDLVGVTPDQLAPMIRDQRGVTALGPIDDAQKTALLAAADVLVAPSLGGESFGMILTEAFAVGTPVLASDIAGYNGVVRDGVEGVLFARGDASALARALLDLAAAPQRRDAMSAAAARRAHDYAWPKVAGQVLEAYTEAIDTPAPRGIAWIAVRLGLRSADRGPHRRARRDLPSLEREPVVESAR
jgi:phosphatidyl-myo-inositol alpha-mannosyltransferase